MFFQFFNCIGSIYLRFWSLHFLNSHLIPQTVAWTTFSTPFQANSYLVVFGFNPEKSENDLNFSKRLTMELFIYCFFIETTLQSLPVKKFYSSSKYFQGKNSSWIEQVSFQFSNVLAGLKQAKLMKQTHRCLKYYRTGPAFLWPVVY